jgi:hypothetical protein
MKATYKSLIAILLIFISSSSCQEKLDEINVDPDTFPSADDATVLSSALGFMSYMIDVDLNMASFLWAQYYTWGIGVALGNQERFVAQPDDFSNYWERAYADVLIDLKRLKKSESAAYRGVARILEAYVYQGLVDHFGDVPYSQAVSGEIEEGGILTPAYDNAATIYASLVESIDLALEEFDVAQNDIGSDDFLYGGNLSKWTKFANSLKLRLLMRTSQVSPQGSAVQALIANGTFIETEADMPQIESSPNAGSQNPMYARMEWGVGDFYFASNATLNVLQALGDPRGTKFYDVATTGAHAGQLWGIDQGTIESEPFTAPASDYSGSSDIAYAIDNPVILMSPWEVWFLRAEAAVRYGTADDEVEAFENAVRSNFEFLGLSDTDADNYLTSLGFDALADEDEKINTIGIQKWISLNGTQEDEGWIEARRFDRGPGDENRIFTKEGGIWQVPPKSVLPGRQFPHAWLIPATERALNPNAPAQRSLTDKIFWDD